MSLARGITLVAVVGLQEAILEQLRIGCRAIAVRVVGSWITAVDDLIKPLSALLG